MARLPRLAVAGHAHLVLMRGLDHQPVVVDDEDRALCVAALRDAAQRHQVLIHALALLDDRLRLLATPVDAAGLGRMVQDFGRRYVGAFNRRHGRRGTLWDGRFRATVVQPGAPALAAMVFVDTEPVRSGVVADAGEHRWSSAAHHLGHRRDGWIGTLIDYWALGNTPFERETAYARLLAQGVPEREASRLDEACRKAWAVGDPPFLHRLSEQAARPVKPRRRGRPPRAAAA